MDWLKQHIFEILTAFVAFYAAALSTTQFILNRQDRRPSLAVSMKWGVETFGNQLGDQVLSISAVNRGSRDLTIVAFHLLLKDGRRLLSPRGPKHTIPKIPCRLAPGEHVVVLLDPDIVERALMELEKIGMGARAEFLDASDTQFISKHSISINNDQVLEII